MSQEVKESENGVQAIFDHAANLMLHENKSKSEVVDELGMLGIDRENATSIVENLEIQINVAKKEVAKKDMLYGALWCVGGTILTISNIGFIFWGAIIFGGYQFFKGLINYNK
jgi:hypothetical protein